MPGCPAGIAQSVPVGCSYWGHCLLVNRGCGDVYLDRTFSGKPLLTHTLPHLKPYRVGGTSSVYSVLLLEDWESL